MNTSVQSYRDLEVWRRGREIVKSIWKLSEKLPKGELYGLTSQTRRAAISIPANIAEGWGRHYPAEFVQFLRKANGSRTELETHLILIEDLELCPGMMVEPMLKELEILGKQLLTLERSLKRRMSEEKRMPNGE